MKSYQTRRNLRASAPETIDISSRAIARAWSIQFGLTLDELAGVIQRVGLSVDAIDRYLRRNRRGDYSVSKPLIVR